MCTIKQPPGKFEGEPCITLLAHEWVMEGMGEVVGIEKDEDPPTEMLQGPFFYSQMLQASSMPCHECMLEILKASYILYWEDSQGFAYSRTLEEAKPGDAARMKNLGLGPVFLGHYS